jgi:hypothetical protein
MAPSNPSWVRHCLQGFHWFMLLNLIRDMWDPFTQSDNFNVNVAFS